MNSLGVVASALIKVAILEAPKKVDASFGVKTESRDTFALEVLSPATLLSQVVPPTAWTHRLDFKVQVQAILNRFQRKHNMMEPFLGQSGTHIIMNE